VPRVRLTAMEMSHENTVLPNNAKRTPLNTPAPSHGNTGQMFRAARNKLQTTVHVLNNWTNEDGSLNIKLKLRGFGESSNIYQTNPAMIRLEKGPENEIQKASLADS